MKCGEKPEGPRLRRLRSYITHHRRKYAMKWKVGDTTITKITEIIYPEFSDVIPADTPDVVKKVKWLFPHFVTPEGMLSLSIHSLIVDTPTAKLVVDTCIGNDR